jgi:hypothetical protein
MPLLNTSEFARVAGVDKAYISRLCKRGKLVRNPAGELDSEDIVNKAFIEKQRRKGKAPKVNLVSQKETAFANKVLAEENPPTIEKKELIKNIKNLGKGERYTFFSDGTLSFVDILLALISNLGPGTKIMLATWQLGVKNIEILKEINKSHDLKILLDVSFQNRCTSAYQDIKMNLGGIIWFTKNHTKVLTIEKDNFKFTILSSANFNKNIRFEFFDITESNELFMSVMSNFNHFFKGPPIGKDERTRPEISNEFKEKFSHNSSRRVFQEELYPEKMNSGEYDQVLLDSLLSGENLNDTLRHLSKESTDRLKTIEQIKKLKMEIEASRNELIPRELVSRTFSKLYAIDINEFKTLGPAITQDIIPIVGTISEKQVMAINGMVDGHLRKVLQHIERIVGDFLKSIEGEIKNE